MLRSLFSGISGMRAHQTMMDVTGNNIANVNTAGYKASSTVFEDTLSQMIKAAGAAQGTNGGVNPAQVGLGVQVAAINTNFGQGATQSTGRSTDLMIQGDGFFAVKDQGETLFTRNGAFTFDASGKLVTSTGAVVQGWTALNGVVNTNGATGDITLPIGTTVAPAQTSAVSLSGNLPAGSYDSAKAPADQVSITKSFVAYDTQGNQYPINYTLTATAANQWSLTVKDTANPANTLATAAVGFDPATGKITTPASPFTVALSPSGTSWTAGSTITLDLKDLTQYGGTNTVIADAPANGAGAAMGELQAFTLSPDGTLVGVYSNGLKQPIAQIALANFNNPPGLEKVGGSMYRTTVNSGTAQLGAAGTGGRGLLQNNSLEMSNVDLAQEFTNLIVAQRGFQANSRVITASDEILQDLVNIKR